MKLLPSEVKSRFIVPAVRKQLSMKLREMGLKQTEIANELGLTQSAVSQYLKDKRGVSKLNIDEELDKEIEKSAREISKSDSEYKTPKELKRICDILDEEGVVCEVHRKHDDLPDKCVFCGN